MYAEVGLTSTCRPINPNGDAVAFPASASRIPTPQRTSVKDVSVRDARNASKKLGLSSLFGVRKKTASDRTRPLMHASAPVHDNESQFANARIARPVPIVSFNRSAHNARNNPEPIKAAGSKVTAPINGLIATCVFVNSRSADESRTTEKAR